MFIIRNIPEHKCFVDIKHVTVTADSVTELAHSMLKSFTTGMTTRLNQATHIALSLVAVTSIFPRLAV